MALPINGTVATTARSASGTTFTADLPTGIQSGEVLCVFYFTSSNIRALLASGWTDNSVEVNSLRLGVIWKVATGSEGATQEFTYSAGGSAAAWSVAARTSLDSTTPFVIANTQSGTEATEDPFTLGAATITGMTTGNHVFLLWGAGATRTLVTLDAGLEAIGSVTGGAAGACLHVAGEEAPGASNSAYSNDMSDSRDYSWMLLEAVPSAGGGGGGGGTHRQTVTPANDAMLPHGIVSMRKAVSGLFVPDRKIHRPRLVPVGIQLQGA